MKHTSFILVQLILLLFSTSTWSHDNVVVIPMGTSQKTTTINSSVLTAVYDTDDVFMGYLYDGDNEFITLASPKGYISTFHMTNTTGWWDGHVYGPYYDNASCTGTKYFYGAGNGPGRGARPGVVINDSGEVLYIPFDTVPIILNGYYTINVLSCEHHIGSILVFPTFLNDQEKTGFKNNYNLPVDSPLKFVVTTPPAP